MSRNDKSFYDLSGTKGRMRLNLWDMILLMKHRGPIFMWLVSSFCMSRLEDEAVLECRSSFLDGTLNDLKETVFDETVSFLARCVLT